MKKRIQHLDLMRGILILYVVFYHMSLTYGYIDYADIKGHEVFNMLSFFMAPFYINSGYLFSDKRSPQEYVTTKFKKLLIPWAFFGGLSVIVYYVSSYFVNGRIGWFAPFAQLPTTMGLSSDTPLWYFFCLFCVCVIYFFANRWLTRRKLHCFIVLSFLFSYLVCKTGFHLLGWGAISLGLVYYHIGRLFREYVNRGEIIDNKILIYCIVIYVTLNIEYPQNMSFVLLYIRTGDFFTNVIFSLSGYYILWCICYFIKSIKILDYIGLNSLVLYAYHRIVLNWVYDPVVRFSNPDITYPEYMLMGGGNNINALFYSK